ncbi:MAG: SpoIIE family protein phosphatase [Candidatus Riflebacteria bacterium]|nr:SpoIIE family protein phosphatase [Candidatus Riflebacteria bacterium]
MPKFSSIGGWLLFIFLPLILIGWCLVRGLDIVRTSEQQRIFLFLSQKARTIIADSTDSVFTKRFFSSSLPSQLKAGKIEVSLNPDMKCIDYPELDSFRYFLEEGAVPDEKTIESWHNLLGWEFQPFFIRSKENFPIAIRWGRNEAWLIWEKIADGKESDEKSDKDSVSNRNAINSQTQHLQAKVNPLLSRKIVLKNAGIGKHKSSSVRLLILTPPSAFDRLVQAFEQRTMAMDVQGAVADLKTRHFCKSQDIDKTRISISLKEGRKTHTDFFCHNNYVSYLEILPGNLALYLEKQLPWTLSEINAKQIWSCTFLFIFVITLFFTSLKRIVLNWPIRFKLFGIFFYVVILPLFTVVILSMGFLQDRSQLKMQELQHTAKEQMMEFDRNFQSEEDSSQHLFDGILDNPDLCSGNYLGFEKTLKKLASDHMFFRFEAWDWDKKPRIIISSSIPDPGFNKLTELLAKHSIEEVSGKPGESHLSPQEAIWLMVIETPELGYLDILRKPGVLHKMRFGNSLFYYFWKAERKDFTKKTSYILFSRSHNQAVIHYLKGALIQNRLFPIFVRDRQTEKWFPRSLKVPELNSLCDAVSRAGESFTSRFQRSGKEYLAVGMPGFKLEKYDLVSVISEEKFQLETGKMGSYIGLGILLAIIIGFSCALFLGNGLLVPISDLSAGITLIRTRDSTKRIPVRGTDELGRLASAFNHLLETAAEMDTARVIQESLIPQNPQAPKGYEIAIRSRMTSAIGGDYLDCFPISPGKIAFLVGDVSGHGIGSALIMAMAKSVVFLHFSEGNDETTIMARLNKALFDLALNRQMMTFCFGTLDSHSHKGFLTIGGHPYPFLYQAASKVAHCLGYPEYPLGVRPRRNFGGLHFSLAPGDTFFMYTDGLVEAVDPEDCQFGYENLRNVIERNGDDSPQKLIETVEKELDTHLKGRSLSDDISIFVIRRQEEL